MAPTAEAFHQLLAWLDEGGESGGEKYLEMRRRLVWYFARKRCLAADELADETLNRVARRLHEEGAIVDASPARYCYIVAKFVFLEYLRRTELQQASMADMSRAGGLETTVEARERSLDCLERCLQTLEQDDRELILEYYRGEQGIKIRNRRQLGLRLGLTANAISIRACRIRDRLEACVNACTGKV
jgi:DNA-directed RNA polymerase specialized sigma24 family protein